MYFQLYQCIIPVRGHARSTLCDLQRRDFLFVSNDLAELLEKKRFVNLPKLRKRLSSEQWPILQERIDELVAKDYGFLTEHPVKELTQLPSGYESNLWIDAIVDFDSSSTHSLKNIIPEFNRLFIPYLKIRFFDNPPDFILSELKHLENSTIRLAEVLIGSGSRLRFGDYIEQIGACSRVSKIIYYDPEASDTSEMETPSLHIIKSNKPITSALCCGKIGPEYFTMNEMTYFVSSKYNSCLYGKISVDSRGYIKNCPAMNKSFGKVDETDLLKVTADQKFLFATTIAKDKIEVCRDCEFRLICPDCRAITKHGGLFDKPAHCTYDPYEAIWK